MPDHTHKLLRLPRELLTALQAHASRRGATVTGLIVHILWEWLESQGYRPATTIDEGALSQSCP